MTIRVVACATVLAACGGHRHGPSTNTNPNTLFVEIHTRGDHDAALRDGAAAGLSQVSFARRVRSGGELEIEAEVSRLDTAGSTTACSVKLVVVRLPEHDLLGIADGSARAGGTDDEAAGDCIHHLTTNLVRGKVRTLLKRRLDFKR